MSLHHQTQADCLYSHQLSVPERSELLERFISTYHKLNTDSIQSSLLDELYTPNVVFIDSVHELSGMEELKRYFSGLYASITELYFDFKHASFQRHFGFIQWTLTYRHPKLNQGKPIKVEGSSYLEFQGEAISKHQDYYDAGAMLYEHIPLLSSFIHLVKKRATS